MYSSPWWPSYQSRHLYVWQPGQKAQKPEYLNKKIIQLHLTELEKSKALLLTMFWTWLPLSGLPDLQITGSLFWFLQIFSAKYPDDFPDFILILYSHPLKHLSLSLLAIVYTEEKTLEHSSGSKVKDKNREKLKKLNFNFFLIFKQNTNPFSHFL